MKRILIGLLIGLVLLEVSRRLYQPVNDPATAGSVAYKAGDYARAEARFGQAEQTDANRGRSAHNHAAALYRLRRFNDADHAYDRSAGGDALRAARAAYDRGDCAFSDACAEEGTADPALLERAVEHYEACLQMEGHTPDAGTLFDDARHNLELAKLILAEFAEEDEAAAEQKSSDPQNPTLARNDAASPASPDQPSAQDGRETRPDGENKASKPADQTHAQDGRETRPDGENKASKPADQPKADQPKAPDAPPKGDPNQQPPKDCKDCKRGGCPKCKKNPGSGAGPLESPKRGDGPKPTPGDADNGKAAGKGKSQQESSHPGSGKGKPGEGGLPSATQKNGVGDAKASGTGPSDANPNAAKPSKPGEGKMVGPDGVTYEKQDQPSPGGKTGAGRGPQDAADRPPQPGGKDGSPQGAPGDGGNSRDATGQPPSAEVDKLFQPGASRPEERKDQTSGGTSSGQGRMGSGRFGLGPDSDMTDGNGDPVERAAARRLRQAVQRIQKARDGRTPPPGSPGEAPSSDRRRDW
jgi:hypothetical protein